MDASSAALLATVASAMVSSLVAIGLFKLGQDKDHESRLFEKRAECYPLLYKLLSDFIKVLEFGTLTENGLDKSFTKQIIVKHMMQLEPWDSAYAILANSYTIDLLLDYRLSLYNLLEEDNHNFAQAFYRPDSPGRRNLINQTRELENAIRWEMRTHNYSGKQYRLYEKYRAKRHRQLKSYGVCEGKR
jgi:hypothetical protein